jgi:prephenate dehydrogenase
MRGISDGSEGLAVIERSLRDSTIGIVGLGLMGGSLALALRDHTGRLIGVESDALTRQRAVREGIVDVAFENLSPDVPHIDLLVLATPVRSILRTLARLPDLRPVGCQVIDLGSTKQTVVTAMNDLPEIFAAIGGHPMCGKETSGLDAAAVDLYRGQTFILCRTSRTTLELERLTLEVLEIIGAQADFLDAAEHDAVVALVSHLPYLVSATLMRGTSTEDQWAISASGLRDTTRLAGTNPRMMIDILLTNRDAILDVLSDYASDLAVLRQLLHHGDENALMEWLARAQVHYAAYRRFRSTRAE